MTDLKLGTLHPIGAKVRHPDQNTDMLIVDMDEARGTRVAAWKDGDAVSEREFNVATLESA
jgi:hypothetical protein